MDVWKRQTWCQPFVWIGMNSITIYMAGNILGGFRRLAERLVGGDIKTFLRRARREGFRRHDGFHRRIAAGILVGPLPLPAEDFSKNLSLWQATT